MRNKILNLLVDNNIILKQGKLNPQCKRMVTSTLREEIIKETSFFASDVSLIPRIIALVFDLVEVPKCSICNKELTKFNPLHVGFSKNHKSCTARANRKIAGEKGGAAFGKRIKTDKAFAEQFSKKVSESKIANTPRRREKIIEEHGSLDVFFAEVQKKKEATQIEKHGSLANAIASFNNNRIAKHGSNDDYKRYVRKLKSQGEFSNIDTFALYNYRRKVIAITYTTNDVSLLENFDKRGRIYENEDAYHLDHKFSIKSGFENSVPPEIIGSIHNLEMIPGKQNVSKGANNSITLGQLLAMIEMNSD